MDDDEWINYMKEKVPEKSRLADFSAELDKIIGQDNNEDEEIPEDKIIVESPPLPELDVSKFGIERGNDEIAMWLKQGRESGHLDETVIGIALMKYNCPMLYEDEYPCNVWKETWNELFHHFKNTHYNEEAELNYAKHSFYLFYVSINIHPKTSDAEEKRIRKRASEPTPHDLKPYLSRAKNRLKWRDTAYAMLQECFIYEANIIDSAEYTGPTKQNRLKSKKRHAVLYRMQKVYGLTTSQISKIFDQPIHIARRNIHTGMMYEHGNNEKNLPEWMQRVLQVNNK